jgi:Dolichyl-phosphate-mannose-protein mannosyltransferase
VRIPGSFIFAKSRIDLCSNRVMSINEAPGWPISPGRASRRGELATVLFLLVCGVGWPVLMSVLACPLTIPRNDAFAYSKVAQTLADQGTIHLIGYGKMSLIGHIVLAQPFFELIDNREAAGNVFGIVMVSITIVLSYALARRFLPRGLAIVVTLTFILVAGLATTTPTFMTENTFMCLTVGTLLAGVLSFQSARYARHWLVLCAVLGFASFTVREFGAVTPLAVIAALAFAHRVSRAFAASLAGAVVVACVAFFEWRQHLPGGQDSALQLQSRSLALPLLALFTLGFYVLPVTLRPALSLLRAPGRLLGAGAIVTVVLAIPAFVGTAEHGLFLHDMLERTGNGGQKLLTGTRPELLPPAVWIVLNAVALVGGICLVVVATDPVRRRLRNRERDALLPLEAFTVAFAVLTAGYGAAFGQLDDRYIWPLVLPVAIIVVGRTERSVAAPERRGIAWLTVAPLLVMFVTSTCLNQDAAAYDGARWAAAQALVDAGASSSQVNGGYEWEGAHSQAIPDLASANNRAITPWEPFYAGFWPPAHRCFVVSNSPPGPAGQLLETRTYRSQLGLRTRTLYVWLRPGQACEAELAALRPTGSAA